MRFAAVLLMFLAADAMAQAVRTWVSTNGSDTNACSRTEPCRNFNAAVAAVASGGEVVVLDSGGFGPVSINKSVSLISPPGIHAAIAPTDGIAIYTYGSAERVVLRGLYLNSQGSSVGVRGAAEFGTLFLERLVVSGFHDAGVSVGTDTPMKFFMSDSIIRRGGDALAGLALNTNSLIWATVVDSTIEGQPTGIYAGGGSRLLARNISLVGNNVGVHVQGNATTTAEAVVDHCLISGPSESDGGGVRVWFENSRATVVDSRIIETGVGLSTFATGSRLSAARNMITRTNTPMSNSSGGTVQSQGNNIVVANEFPPGGTITTFQGR